jgi:hypothetical protein
MDQPVPQVSPEDVLRIVRRDFAPHEISEVSAMLDEVGDEPRIQLAILKLASGNKKRVREVVEDAKLDFRDVLSGAEYPEYSTKMPVVTMFPNAEIRKILDEDWEQYQNWLRR